MKILMNAIVILTIMAILSGPVLALDNGSVNPVTYYDPSTKQTTNYFPLGWYSWLITPSELIELKNLTGCNTVHFSDVNLVSSYDALVQLLDVAYSNGMKVTIAIQRELFQPSLYPYTLIQEKIDSLKNHPAILGWQLGDENNLYSFLTAEAVTNCAAAVHQADPNRQVWQVFGGSYTSDQLSYTTGTNIVSTDKYEYTDGKAEFYNAAEHLNAMQTSVQTAQSQNQGYVNVAQGVGASAGDLEYFRFPTAAEYRYEVYSSIASAGARGIFNWTYVTEGYGWYNDYSEFTDFCTDVVKPVFQEVTTMQHALETGYEVGNVTMSWNETWLEKLSWNNEFDRLSQLLVYDDEQDKYFLIVVNNSTDSRNMQATISGLPKELASLNVTSVNGESLTLTDLGGGSYQLNDSLNHHEADVYVFQADPKVDTAVHYTFKETAPGTWEVLVDVTGDDTAGLSAYEIWVDGVDPSLVSFEENTLATVVGENYTPAGFLSGTLVQGEVGGSFNAGNYQGCGDAAILGIGMEEVYEEGSLPGITPLVDLDVPALLGILNTPTGLGEENFRAIVAALLNAAGDGFLDEVIPTYEVIPLEWLFGDANHDGVVSAADYSSVQANFGNIGDFILGDANGDGVVSAADYSCIQANFGSVAGATVTPEPITIGLLSIGGLLGLLRKRNTLN